MTVGGLAFRAGRIGFLSAAAKLPVPIRSVPLLLQGASHLFALTMEVGAFETSHRALLSLNADSPTVSGLWKWSGKGGLQEGLLQSFVNFSALKGFGKLAEGQNWLLQHSAQDLGMIFGRHLAHQIGLGEKPVGSLAEQCLQAEILNLQLGAGASLAHQISGGRLLALEKSLELSAALSERSLASSSPLPRFLAPALSTAERTMKIEASENAKLSGIYKMTPLSEGDAALPSSASAHQTGYYNDRKIHAYRDMSGSTLMGDLVRNIERRLQRGESVAVLDIGSGKGYAARDLKEIFGEKIRVETNDRDPLEGAFSDHHHRGDFLESPFSRRYDLLLAIYGPHAHHEGRFFKMLQRTADLMNPGAEFVAALTPASIDGGEYGYLKNFSSYPKIAAALEKGFLIRIEQLSGGALLYLKKISPEGAPLSELFSMPVEFIPYQEAMAAKQHIQKELERNPLKAFGLEASAKDVSGRVAENFTKLGRSEHLKDPHAFATELFTRWASSFQGEMGRLPTGGEIYDWIRGNEPSALIQESLLVDEALRIDMEKKEVSAAPQNGGSTSKTSLALFLGAETGLSKSLFPFDVNLSDFSPWQHPYAWAVGLAISLGAVGLGRWAYKKYFGEKRWFEAPPYSQLKLPLTEEERRMLAPVFGKEPVPKILRGKHWGQIEDKISHGNAVQMGTWVVLLDPKLYQFWLKVNLHLEELKTGKKSPLPQKEEDLPLTWVSKTGGEAQNDLIAALSQGIISLDERRQEKELGIPALYDHYLTMFPREELGDELRRLMRSDKSDIRENAIRLYDYHSRQLMKAKDRTKLEETHVEILTGAKALQNLTTENDPKLRALALSTFERVKNHLPPSYQILLQKEPEGSGQKNSR